MPKQNKSRTRRVKNLIVVCTLIAVVLSVSTYAWFVGMRPVNVSSFDVEIASTDSLLLSLNGVDWSQTVSISKATVDEVSYLGHTNNWAGRGLIPMSSIGEIDTAVSRLKLFQKASHTPTAGGYRIMASRVNNYKVGDPERDGYVVFDLFVKNFTGTQYIELLNEDDEESIYLTIDSEVAVAADGVPNTGIENSVRVAFAQIGRVTGFTKPEEAALVTGITCNPNELGEPSVVNGVTGICRVAQIWEPNDTFHEQNAIKYYNTSCLARTGVDVRAKESYAGACGSVIDGLAYPTYAIKGAIKSSDNVDVYDGPAFNKYVVPEGTESLLYSYPYFTDTMKLKTGTKRPEFMSLAPNSITKIRVYIYLEGQDIDNYDWASIGKKISVKFGFTKERMTEDDFNYDGQDPNQGDGPGTELEPVPDKTVPVITLTGDNPMNMDVNTEYVDPGATATDNKDDDLTLKIEATGTVNPNVVGTYYVTYTVTDAAGNVAKKTRTVNVDEVTTP